MEKSIIFRDLYLLLRDKDLVLKECVLRLPKDEKVYELHISCGDEEFILELTFFDNMMIPYYRFLFKGENLFEYDDICDMQPEETVFEYFDRVTERPVSTYIKQLIKENVPEYRCCCTD